jgi:hypothetical protein
MVIFIVRSKSIPRWNLTQMGFNLLRHCSKCDQIFTSSYISAGAYYRCLYIPVPCDVENDLSVVVNPSSFRHRWEAYLANQRFHRIFLLLFLIKSWNEESNEYMYVPLTGEI